MPPTEPAVREISKARRALEYRLAGLPYDVIATQLDLPGAAAARDLVMTGVEQIPVEVDAFASDLDIERLNQMFYGVWPTARDGEPTAIELALKLLDLRRGIGQLLRVPAPDTPPRSVKEFEADRLDLYPWAADYLALRKVGWEWKRAAFIAWTAMPAALRVPRTQQELAVHLGLTSDRMLRRWRSTDPQIDEAISAHVMTSLLKHRADVLDAMVRSALQPGGVQDRRMYLEMVKAYIPRLEHSTPPGRPFEVKDAAVPTAEERADRIVALFEAARARRDRAADRADSAPSAPESDGVRIGS